MLRSTLKDDLKQRASGHWRQLLISAGCSPDSLDGRGHPCPKCGGRDRFSVFKDFEETGGVHCRHCFTDGADGFSAIGWLLGLSFGDAKTWVEQHLSRHATIDRLQSKLPRGQSWPTCREAVAALDRFMSRRHDGARQAGLWTYRRGCEPIAVVVRYDYATGKTYRPVSRHADGWRWSDPVDSWPLYGDLPESLDCVFVTEGEKCADVVRSFGLVAVTSAHGAGSAQKTDWTKLATAQRVVILPDCDDAGGRYAAEVERLVRSASVSDVRIVELPGLQSGEDVADWSNGRDPDECRAELLALADSSSPVALTFQRRRRPKLVRLSDVEPETVRWLWPGRIALGKLTLFAGDPGLGKSFLTMDIAARVTTGTTWPDSPTVAAPRGSVV
ncbi:MAG: AAA family ATPase, partial [Planctomycetales bacterium]|nr:AAA family ATPase [Planctomycetales bacterium]